MLRSQDSSGSIDLSAPQLRVAEATDADDHAAGLTGWKQAYDQITPGRFRGTLRELWLEKNFQVFEEATSHSLRQNCEVWSGGYWFGIPVGNTSKGRIGTRVLEEGTIAVRPGGVSFQLQTPSSFRIFGLVVERGLLHQYIGEIQGAEVDVALLEREMLDAAPARYSLLKTELLRTFESPNLLLSHDNARQNLRDGLLHALAMQCVAQKNIPQPSLTYTDRHRLVKRALDYALSYTNDSISIPQLCRALRVSRRTLQYAFQDVCDISPAAYLRILRLNRARRALRDRASAFTDVRDIASQFGFWHASQFASDYRRFFGERPSETLRRRTSIR